MGRQRRYRSRPGRRSERRRNRCPYWGCGFSMRDLSYEKIQVHVFSVHLLEGKIECPFSGCDFVFRIVEDLDLFHSHMKLKHGRMSVSKAYAPRVISQMISSYVEVTMIHKRDREIALARRRQLEGGAK